MFDLLAPRSKTAGPAPLATEPLAEAPTPKPVDPVKQQGDLHSGAVTVAKAVSDCFYKIDSAITKLPAEDPLTVKLKAVRDAVFVQKGVAEGAIQAAGGGVSPLPSPITPVDAVPVIPDASSATEAPTPPPPPLDTSSLPQAPPSPRVSPGAPVATPTAGSKVGVSIPTAQAEKVWAMTKDGRAGAVGNLSTDGSIISLYGHPIFKVQNGMVYGSWAGHPTMTTAANVNSLAQLAGLPRVFSLHNDKPTFQGREVEVDAWVALGPAGEPADPLAMTASTHLIPDLLLPKNLA